MVPGNRYYYNVKSLVYIFIITQEGRWFTENVLAVDCSSKTDAIGL